MTIRRHYRDDDDEENSGGGDVAAMAAMAMPELTVLRWWQWQRKGQWCYDGDGGKHIDIMLIMMLMTMLMMTTATMEVDTRGEVCFEDGGDDSSNGDERK